MSENAEPERSAALEVSFKGAMSIIDPIERVLEEARSTPDDAVRATAYREVQEAVLADVPMVTLYYPLSTMAKRPVLQGEVVRFSWINLDLRQATLSR